MIDAAEMQVKPKRAPRGQREHELKSWPEFFQPTLDGVKTHDLRRADEREFQVGDRMRLREFDPVRSLYTGREMTVEITYITSAELPCALSKGALDPRFCILSIRKLTDR